MNGNQRGNAKILLSLKRLKFSYYNCTVSQAVKANWQYKQANIETKGPVLLSQGLGNHCSISRLLQLRPRR